MLTREQARELCVRGWNIRCNLCGSYGANWIHRTPCARPGWGSLSLCPEHEAEYIAEETRHAAEMRRLRTINYEQEYRP